MTPQRDFGAVLFGIADEDMAAFLAAAAEEDLEWLDGIKQRWTSAISDAAVIAAELIETSPEERDEVVRVLEAATRDLSKPLGRTLAAHVVLEALAHADLDPREVTQVFTAAVQLSGGPAASQTPIQARIQSLRRSTEGPAAGADPDYYDNDENGWTG